eukprot:TRINITY_DN12510_c0_g1_i1.p1 TRINITY_DN12510_c0_g1~~TRINITY_DN12510_c0_g1_i1.p1  ORF type:complete len:588 (+),score=101.58 TRINITY_DN12510_c0_g1_i1:126-1889(+)
MITGLPAAVSTHGVGISQVLNNNVKTLPDFRRRWGHHRFCSLQPKFRKIQRRYSHSSDNISNYDSSLNERDNPPPKKSSLFLKAKVKAVILLQYLKKLISQTVPEIILSFARQHALPISFSTAGAALLCICYFASKIISAASPVIVPYSELVKSIESGKATSVLFEEGSRRVLYNEKALEKDPEIGEKGEEIKTAEKNLSNEKISNISNNNFIKARLASKWQYSTRRIPYDEKYLLRLLRENGVSYSSAPLPLSASLTKILATVLTVWIPLMPLMWLLLKQISGNNSGQRRRRTSSKQAVRFSDVAGVDAAKAELMEIVLCLQGSINYSKLGANLPKGVLLVGPPGTGKTLLARAVAGEAGVPFYAVSASEFVELYVGRGAARIRDLFKVARKCAPTIIFIDELDAVGGHRGKSFNDERDQTLNQLLTEMDGFESNAGVLVIAATNRPEALDPALCRPGRFSRRVFVKEPDLEGRKRIVAIHLRSIPTEEDPELLCSIVASATSGFVGADLANVVNEAALLAARQGKDAVTLDCLKAAVHRAKYGIGDEVNLATDIGKGIGRLFPWISSRNTSSKNDQPPMGYQTVA